MTTPPNIPAGAMLYGQSVGSVSSNSLVNAIRATRAPSSTDIKGPQGNFTIGQRWIDTLGLASYTLCGFSAAGGTITASWVADGGGSSSLGTLSGDSGTATPSGGNIQIAGGSGVVTSASGSVVTVSLTGGGVAIDSFAPDAGTNPVVPSSTGLITMAGTAQQITTTGGTNTLTFSLPTTMLAPGSLASTTSLVAGTSLLVNGGSVIITNGNVSFGAAGNKTVYLSVGTTTSAGANSAGSVALASGTATVTTAAVTANSLIRLTCQALGTVTSPQALAVTAKTANTSFVITSAGGTDTSTVFWEIVN